MEKEEHGEGAAPEIPSERCKGGVVCSALVELEPGEGGIERETKALLGCGAFLWDVLLEGEWSGCSRPIIRSLVRRYGATAVKGAFDGR